MKYWEVYESKIGPLTILCDDQALLRIDFGTVEHENAVREQSELICKTEGQLEEYMAGTRTEFDLPLKPEGTEFQKKVWNALLLIPYGATKSYKDIAVLIDNPKGCRAVGMANNRNPIPIIIPCSFSVDNFVIIDSPIGDKHNSPKVITNNAIVKTLREVIP